MNVQLTTSELNAITRALRATTKDMPSVDDAADHPTAALYWRLLDTLFREDMADEMSKFGCD